MSDASCYIGAESSSGVASGDSDLFYLLMSSTDLDESGNVREKNFAFGPNQEPREQGHHRGLRRNRRALTRPTLAKIQAKLKFSVVAVAALQVLPRASFSCGSRLVLARMRGKLSWIIGASPRRFVHAATAMSCAQSVRTYRSVRLTACES